MIFGTLLRVVYFMGVTTCAAFLVIWIYTMYSGGGPRGIWDLTRFWSQLRNYSDAVLGVYGVAALFAGMWIGAASHTFTDLAGTYIKTGKRGL